LGVASPSTYDFGIGIAPGIASKFKITITCARSSAAASKADMTPIRTGGSGSCVDVNKTRYLPLPLPYIANGLALVPQGNCSETGRGRTLGVGAASSPKCFLSSERSFSVSSAVTKGPCVTLLSPSDLLSTLIFHCLITAKWSSAIPAFDDVFDKLQRTLVIDF